tara:strand:- start:193 stop:468 length:276 start_codon:yes stop_codon:yes gene_type:complete
MSLGKRDIVKNISAKASLSNLVSGEILNSFLSLIKSNSVNKTIKISNFGSFYYKKTPKRIGRNPKTKETFPIPARSKLVFLSSNKVKDLFN